MIFRLSQKLNKKIKAGTLDTVPLDENSHADWSAHLFTADRMQFVILTNTPSLCSCVTFGKGITNDSRFVKRALDTIREFMADDGLESVFQRFIAPASGTVGFAKALNRSVIGSMNDLVQGAKWHLLDGLDLHEVGVRLNETPLSALGYANPREAFKALADNRQSSGGSGEERPGGEISCCGRNVR